MKHYFHVYYHNSWHFMDINCILMKCYLIFMIIIQVFQMDIICILMKCDSKHENNNSWHFMDIKNIKIIFH